MFMPIIMAKIIPFDGNSTIPQANRTDVGNGYREELDQTIKHKCIYGLWNDRGSIYTMGFKLNCKEDLEALKKMEPVYKEECHVHQFIIPFETAVWNEEDIPPRRPQQNNAPNESIKQGSQQSNTLTLNTDQQATLNNGSGSGQNTNNEQRGAAALPPRETQN